MINRIKPDLLGMLAALLLFVACTPSSGKDQPAPRSTEPETAATIPTETPSATTTTEPATATAEPSPTATATPLPTKSPESFINSLKLAIAARDFMAMQSLMADPFAVGVWLSEAGSYSPEDAITAFHDNNLLPEGAQITWADPDFDLRQILGMPPASMRPFAEVAAALYSYGWGEDGSSETILFIVRQPDGSHRWEMILVSALGYIGFPTEVTSVIINTDEVTFYSGPGESYEPVATVFGGQTYPVVSTSSDQQWWRLRCYDDANAPIPQCWVSADPIITSPIAPEISPED